MNLDTMHIIFFWLLGAEDFLVPPPLFAFLVFRFVWKDVMFEKRRDYILDAYFFWNWYCYFVGQNKAATRQGGDKARRGTKQSGDKARRVQRGTQDQT